MNKYLLKLSIVGLIFLIVSCNNNKKDTVVLPAVNQQNLNNGAVIEDPNGLIPTIYYAPIVDQNSLGSQCSTNEYRRIKNQSGVHIGTLCTQQLKICTMQGSCFLKDSRGMRLVNFSTKKITWSIYKRNSNKSCYYGVGSRGACLDPYFSIAADPNLYKQGDVIFVPRVRGLLLPNGETHDGFFIVRDSGRNIVDRKIDFFTGFDGDDININPFKKLGLSDPNSRIQFQRVPESEAYQIRINRNYPYLNSNQAIRANQFYR